MPRRLQGRRAGQLNCTGKAGCHHWHPGWLMQSACRLFQSMPTPAPPGSPPGSRSGMLILVYARNHLRDSIGEVTTASVACGVLGVGGNKGAVAVEFSLHRRRLAVLCSHFAAHQVRGWGGFFLFFWGGGFKEPGGFQLLCKGHSKHRDLDVHEALATACAPCCV